MKRKVRLNLNEFPLPPEVAMLQAAQEACARANRYPDFDGHTLKAALAAHFDVEPEWVSVGSGSAAVIQQIMIATGPGDVAFGWPSFDAFPYLAAGLRMGVQKISLKNGACDLQALAAAITPRTKVVIICTPNTPTGGTVTHSDLATFLAGLSPHVIAIIDEAYGDFVREPDAVRALEFVRQYPNVVMSRTFSKTHAMAGFRVGYAIAQPKLTARICATGVPFNVPLPAQAAAVAALASDELAKARIESLIKERTRLAAELRDRGMEVPEGHGNFVWLPIGKKAQRIAAALAHHDILVKAFMPFGLRITVGTAEEIDYLLESWPKVMAKIKQEKGLVV